MDRRRALWILAGTVSASVFTPDLLALGRELHAQLPAAPSLQTLTPEQDALVATMAEIIIPATETPGARAARVNEFIDVLLTDWLEKEDRDAFLAGLQETDRRSREQFGHDFVDCSPQQQVRIVAAYDDELTRRLQSEPPRSYRWDEEVSQLKDFFYLMKRFTLIGYYTSEIGAQQELGFQVIPTRFEGCVPIEAGKTAAQRGGHSHHVTIAPAPGRD